MNSWRDESCQPVTIYLTSIKTILDYLTIRLRARNFDEVIVNEGEARVNYRFIEIENE